MENNKLEISNNQKYNKQYPLVDLIKYIFSILIVSIHISPLSSYFVNIPFTKYINYGIVNYVARLAVPFYFAIAGFFLSRKIDLKNYNPNYSKEYIFKLCRLLGLWSILLFVGVRWQLWYMSGLIVAVCIFSFLLRKRLSLKQMTIIAILLYLIGLVGDSYYGVLEYFAQNKLVSFGTKAYFALFGTTRNGLFMGYPFFLLGVIIEKKELSIKPIRAILGFIVSMIFLFFEVFLVKKWGMAKDLNMYIFLFPVILYLLMFVLNVSIKEKTIFKSLRNIGVIVYFCHMFVYQFVMWGFQLINKLFCIEINNSLLNYWLTILLSTLIGYIIDTLSRKEKFSFLKCLYS